MGWERIGSIDFGLEFAIKICHWVRLKFGCAVRGELELASRKREKLEWLT